MSAPVTAAAAANRSIDEAEATPEISEQALALRCDLTVELAMPGFRVSDVLGLRNHTVVDSRWHVGADIPLRLNGRLIARGEFEVIADRLGVRLTELV